MKRIFSLILAFMAVQLMFAQINVFKVTNTDDTGEGSLRAAVEAVNEQKESSDSSRIVFDFSTNVEHVISLESLIQLSGSRVAIDASDCKGTVVLDGVDKSFAGIKIDINQYNVTIKALTFRNFKYGIDVDVTRNACIDGCVFESNEYGVDLGACISEVLNCTFVGNEVGVEVSNPWILGSDDDIVNNSVNHIHDNFIGITSSDKENGNEIGIRIGDKKPTYVNDNVICSNQYGIYFWDKGHDCYIRRNYIGVNKKYKAHGNSEAGISIGHNVGPIEIGSKDKEDGNYIGYNKVGRVNDKGNVNMYNNYIGVTPNFQPMPNKEAGVSAQSIFSSGNYIGFNGTNGMEMTSYSNIGADFIGGDGEHSFPNEGYGIYGNNGLYGNLTETLIFNNKEGGVMLDYTPSSYPGPQFEYSRCLFGGDQPFAVKKSDENINAPVIENVYVDDDYVYIEGSVGLLDEEKKTSVTLVLDPEITIELFANDGGTESALEYLGTTVTDAEGKWLYKLEKSKYVNNIVATATHQFHQSYSTSTISRYTSRFSEPCLCPKFLYDLTRLNYYVKTKREGKGDGSSWDNAMDGYDFASVLPLVSDGATFHVAAGEYEPKFGKNLQTAKQTSELCYEVNSKVTIIGGYPANAKGTVKSEPDKYETVLNGDINHDNKEAYSGAYGAKFTFLNFEDNVNIMFVQNADLNLRGVKIKGCFRDGVGYFAPLTMYKEKLKLNLRLVDFWGNSSCVLGFEESEIDIDSCRFEKNVGCGNVAGAITNGDHAKLVVKNTIFDQCNTCYLGGAIKNTTSSNVYIENSTFDNCYAEKGSAIYLNGNLSSLHSVNSTYVNNTGSSVIFEAPGGHEGTEIIELYNNTILSNDLADGYAVGLQSSPKLTLIGNVVESIAVIGSSDNVISRDNIFMCDLDARGSAFASLKEEVVFSMSASDCPQVFEGKYNSQNNKFDASLKYNGGFTPTVALKSDKLSDNTSIRFARLDDVLNDQRGTTRLGKTCMGAYEIECGKDTTLVVDTIEVGTKYIDGKVYEKIGIYEEIFTNHKTELGCDSVVNHTLFVVPKSTIKEYYVKTQKEGTGDGSDWDNAMDPKDFAFVFENLKTEGVTFYVAAGTYHAVYNGWGKETNDKNAHWASRHGANIYGGYDPKSTGDASTTKADPAKYRTIFTGDVKGDDKVVMQGDCEYSFENFSDNMVSSMISMEISSDIHISGIELTGMSFSRGSSPALIRLLAQKGTEYKVTIDYCRLNVSDKGIEANNVHDLTVDQCEFEYVRNSAVYSDGECKVSRSTLFHTGGINYSGYKSGLAVENSTFVKNRSDIQVYTSAESLPVSAQIHNNTFISCESGAYFSFYDNVSASVSGNIFAGSSISIYKRNGDAEQQLFTNNLLACESIELGESGTEKDNVKVSDITTLYKGILEGKYSEKDAIFTPELTYKGAFTRTVALLKDKLSDGTSIRFPRFENIPADQRGTTRLDKTCMGAYEIECVLDTVLANDTIYVGTEIFGQTFTTVGVFDSIFQNFKSVDGCDSVVMHKVVVKPDPGVLNYYVKTERWGNGDGSSWDDAMNGEDFAARLPVVPDGAIFYVAEGEYKPIYDQNGDVSDYPLYNVNSSISIYGGYPNNATGTNVPSEPEKYKTILGYDVNSSFALFYSKKTDLLRFVLDGIYVNNYDSYVIQMPSVDLTLRNSYFEGNSNFCDVSNEGSLNVVNTEFSKTQSTLFSMYGTKSVYMEDVKFVDNIPSSYFYGDGYDVILKSVNATNNNGYYYFIGSKKLLVENSEFIKNSVGSYLLTTSGTVDIQNSLFDQNEGSMLVNSYLDYEDNYINISKSKFSNNTTSSPVVFGAGSSINCTLTESEFSSNNCYDLLCLEGSNNLAINDCEFLSNNCERSNPNWAYDPFMIQISKSVKKVQIERNKFIGNNSPTSLVRCNCDTLDFKDCFLDKNNTDSRELLSFIICTNSQNTEKNVAYVERNTFSNNKCLYLMFLFNNSHDVYLRNNTIVSNECSSEIWYPKYSNLTMQNNTIVGNKCKSISFHDFRYNSMVGNLIFGNQYEELYHINPQNVENDPSYNIMTLTQDFYTIKVLNSTNIISEYYINKVLDEIANYPGSDDISNIKDMSVDIASVLDGTYDASTGLFIPVVKDNGGLTPTVALLTDRLPDGTYIRFPLTETSVTEDQRGVTRLEMTCMGAYEIVCDATGLDSVLIDPSVSNNDIIRDEQTKMYDNTCINDSLYVKFYVAGGCGTNLNGDARVVYKYSNSEEVYTSHPLQPQKLANVDMYEILIPYNRISSYIKYRIEVSNSKNNEIIMTSPSPDGFWNVNTCDSAHVKIDDPVFSLCREKENKLNAFVRLEGDTVNNGKLKFYYSEVVSEESSSSKFLEVEMTSPDGENYYAENIEMSENTKYFDYYITYSDGDNNILNSYGNGQDNIIRVSTYAIDSVCVDPCNNIKLSSHVLVEQNDTLSFDVYRKNTKVELFLCDESGNKIISEEYNNLSVENAKLALISKLSLRSKNLNLSYVHPYILALKIDGKVSCMYVYLGRKKIDK